MHTMPLTAGMAADAIWNVFDGAAPEVRDMQTANMLNTIEHEFNIIKLTGKALCLFSRNVHAANVKTTRSADRICTIRFGKSGCKSKTWKRECSLFAIPTMSRTAMRNSYPPIVSGASPKFFFMSILLVPFIIIRWRKMTAMPYLRVSINYIVLFRRCPYMDKLGAHSPIEKGRQSSI